MANHSLPTTGSLYTDVINILNEKIADSAKVFDPANTTATNVPTGTIRWTSASNKWEKWNGTAWSDLTATYAISISGNAATATSAGSAGTATTLATARTINGTSFNGSANIITANWGSARTITIGATGKSVNGSADMSWSLAELGTNVYWTTPRNDGAFASGYLRVVSTNFTIDLGATADTVWTVFNNSAAPVTAFSGSGVTLRLDGTTLTGDRTVLPFGKVSVHWITTTLAVISGSVQ